MNARQLAHEVLETIDSKNQYANLALASSLDHSELHHNEAALVTDIVMGVTRMRRALDWLLGAYLKRDIKHLPPGVHNWLRLAVYQLVFMPGLHQHAVINETVEAVKQQWGRVVAGVVNGVARSIQRDAESLPWPDRAADLVGYLGVVDSYPDWLVKMWVAELGAEAAEALMKAQNERRSLTLRVNSIKTTVSEVVQSLAESGLETTAGLYAPEAIHVSGGRVLQGLFPDGSVYAQDESSMLAVRALAPEADDSVLDMCAAPGGKAGHIAALIANTGNLYCVESNKARAHLLNDNLVRLGVTIATIIEADATLLELPDRADRVLVDAPCSGLGSLYRKADLRWRRRENDIPELVDIQKRLLTNGWKLLKPGGRLVYSVCTISRQETTEVEGWFLREHADAEALDVTRLPGIPELDAAQGPLQLLPHVHHTDGMFVAAFEKS